MIEHMATVYDYDKVLIECPGGNKSMVLHCTMAQYNKGMEAYEKGAYIQNAFPFLSPDEREFLITGTTPDEWQKLWDAK